MQQVLARFDSIAIDSLPKCLVHGDLTKGNVLVHPGNKPVIIDFSVTNWATRIIELSLIVSNLLYDEQDSRSLHEKSEVVASLYQRYNPLTAQELVALPDLALASASMELLGGVWRQHFFDDNSDETQYWLELGRKTLQQELS